MNHRGSLEFLEGGGEMGARMRAFDWRVTGLGPPESWTQSLKTIIRVMLDSRFAMWMSWGAEGTFFCNDAYLPTLGLKQQWALGARSDKVWSEIWHDIGPRIEHVLSAGSATWDEGLQLFLRRSGYEEETFHTFSYSPVYDDDDRIAGMLCVVAEDTQRVIGERRLGLLRELAATPTTQAVSVAAAAALVLNAVTSDLLDVPFAALFMKDDPQRTRLIGTAPMDLDGTFHESSVASMVLLQKAEDALRQREPSVVLEGEIEIQGPWQEPVRQALVFALNERGDPHAMGLLVLGVSTRRQLDAPYRTFLGLVADQFASQLSNAQTRLGAQQKAQALAELDRAKNLFFSNASHELRTPLTLMIGPIENLISRRDLPADTSQELELALRNGNRLRKLVNSLLDFSRIEAGRLEARYQRTDLAAYTVDIASVFRAAIEQAGLRFEVRCSGECGMAYVDREMWEKVVLNLLSNALKFTFEGAIVIELASSNGAARLTVRDTGGGIEESELPKIFDRFHRVPGAQSRSQEGTGIGLALVKELIKLHGGTITATSQKGVGSVFEVTIPLGKEHLPIAHVDSGASTVGTASDRSLYVQDALRASEAKHEAWVPDERGSPSDRLETRDRVLVVDDNADMRGYVQRLLQSRWQVTTAADGLEALRLIAEVGPDLVLTDMMMPKLDGAALIDQIRADEATRALPVIVVSAQAGEEARIAGLQLGADDYLVKPFNAAELIARIEVQLMRAKVRRVEDLLNKRLADVFRNAPVGVALLRGPKHVYEFMNSVYQNMVGQREMLGRPIRDALPELEGQGLYELLDQVYETGKAYNGHAHPVKMINAGTGRLEQRYFEFVYQPLVDEAQHESGIAVVTVDVSELVAARKAAEAVSRTKDEFIAMLGHELRNPLAPIATALQLMKLRMGDVAVNERAIIERQVKHMTRLVDDLLDVSRIARGHLELKKEVVELATVVDKALETAGPLFEKMRQSVSVDVPRAGMPIMADPVRLCQVISNLLTNAAKFGGREGAIEIRASVGGELQTRDAQIILDVQDHGAGMTREELGSVFEMFVQGRQGIHRPQGGLGLGLAIARNLAELHGGSLGASSEGVGKGTTFTLRLPLNDNSDVRVQAERGSDNAGGVKRRILLVDDIEDVAVPLRDLLQELGHDVLLAVDGPSALKLLATSGPVDVALLDIGLPVMDGYELAGHVRKAHGSLPVRLVALSGFGQSADKEKSASHGFDLHLVKPVQLDELLRAVGMKD